jgi:hypothetical protein
MSWEERPALRELFLLYLPRATEATALAGAEEAP